MEDLVEELIQKHQKDKDLTGPKVQQEVKRLRKKYNHFYKELKDDEQLIGLDWSGADLQVFNLKKLILSDHNLPANFQNANLSYAHLEGALLQSADLEGAKVLGAHLQAVIFELANLKNTNLGGAILDYANLNLCNINGSNIEYAHFNRPDIHEIDKKELKKVIRDEKFLKKQIELFPKELRGDLAQEPVDITLIKRNIEHINERWRGYWQAANIYRNIKNVLHQNGEYQKESDYHYKEHETLTKYYRTSLHFKNWIFNLIFRWLCGYGEKPLRIIGWFIVLILFFGTFFLVTGGLMPESQTAILRPLDYYYFSLITAATLSFGDIVPNPVVGLMDISWFRFTAMIEAFLGTFLFALFVVVAAKRIMR